MSILDLMRRYLQPSLEVPASTQVAAPQPQPQAQLLAYNAPAQRVPVFSGRRYDPKRNTVETMDTQFAGNVINPTLDAIRSARELGYTMPDADTIAAMALQEGRSDLGYNAPNLDVYTVQTDDSMYDEYQYKGDPKLKALYDQLAQKYGEYPAGTAVLMAEKQRMADRLGVPFARAWNGMGRSKVGKTGNDYARAIELTKRYALPHETNRAFRAAIRARLAGEG